MRKLRIARPWLYAILLRQCNNLERVNETSVSVNEFYVSLVPSRILLKVNSYL